MLVRIAGASLAVAAALSAAAPASAAPTTAQAECGTGATCIYVHVNQGGRAFPIVNYVGLFTDMPAFIRDKGSSWNNRQVSDSACGGMPEAQIADTNNQGQVVRIVAFTAQGAGNLTSLKFNDVANLYRNLC